MAVPHKILEMAWKGVPQHGAVPAKVRLWEERGGKRRVATYHATKTKKMLILHNETPFTKNLIAVAFPKREHMEQFRDAAEGVRAGGPAQFNPGAIGTVELKLVPGTRPPIYYLDHAQAHFMTKGNPNLRDPEKGLERGLATYYGSWRKRCMEQLLQEVIRKNGTAYVMAFAEPEIMARVSQAYNELGGICRELGLRKETRKITYRLRNKDCEGELDVYCDAGDRARLVVGEEKAFAKFMEDELLPKRKSGAGEKGWKS